MISKDKWKSMDENNASKALDRIGKMLDEMNIRYGLLFGTALRLYRDKKFGKDWDIDLFMLGEDLDKFSKRIAMQSGFINIKVKSDIPKWKKSETEFSDENYTRTISLNIFDCRIDIDPIYISSDGKSRIGLKGRKRQRFAFIHPKEYFENMDTVEYQGNKYNIPTPIDLYLKSNYGDWKSPVHEHRSWGKRKCMSQIYDCK